MTERESVQKHYFYDNGLLNLFLLQPETKLLENLVALTLYKNHGDRLYYYNRNIEIDFYIPSENIAIQASFDVSDSENKERELSALVSLHKYHQLNKAIVITFDTQDTVITGGLTIELIPVWKYLLENDSKFPSTTESPNFIFQIQPVGPELIQ